MTLTRLGDDPIRRAPGGTDGRFSQRFTPTSPGKVFRRSPVPALLSARAPCETRRSVHLACAFRAPPRLEIEIPNMRSQDSRGGSGRRSGRGPRRSSPRAHNDHNDRDDRNEPRAPQRPPAKKTFWQKLVSFFKPDAKSASSRPAYPAYPAAGGRPEPRTSRAPETVEVTTPKLYIGNLSYDATENDLH